MFRLHAILFAALSASAAHAAPVAVTAVTGAPVVAAAAGPEGTLHQPQIDRIVAQISPQRIAAYVRKLASFETRHTMSDTTSETRGIGAARRWIKSELERCGAGTGLQVAFDSHIAPVSARISRPTEIVNVVATLPGKQPASQARLYVVSGHYDSRNSDVMDASGQAPGANDDASGSAAVIELACVMAQYSFDATLVFMTVAAEEQGLLGAGHWARQARAQNLNVAGMLNNDMVGNARADDGRIDRGQVRLFAQGIPATKEMSEAVRALVATGGENDSPTRQLARHVKEQGERYVPGFKVNVIQRADRYLRGGDHMPFLEQGYAAVRLTEPNEDFSRQHQNLRSENGKVYGDLAEFVDPAYAAQVTRVNAAALAALALAPAAPQGVRVRTDKLVNDTTLVWQANPEPDLAGYRIVWRDTTAASWEHALWVGKVLEATVPVSKDNVFFGVQAIDKEGNVSVASYPLPLR